MDDDHASLTNTPKRLLHYRQGIVEKINQAIRSSECVERGEGLREGMSEILQAINCESDCRKWGELQSDLDVCLSVMKSSRSNAGEVALMKDMAGSVEASLMKELGEGEFVTQSTVPTPSGRSDLASFFSSCHRHDGPWDLPIMTALTSHEQNCRRQLAAQLACFVEAVRLRFVLTAFAKTVDQKLDPLTQPASRRDAAVEVIDSCNRVLNTQLWPALLSMAFESATPLKMWRCRLKDLSETMGAITYLRESPDGDVASEKCAWENRQLRNDLIYVCRSSLCGSCFLIPGSFTWRCCGRRICQRCLCYSMMLVAPSAASPSTPRVTCIVCKQPRKLNKAVCIASLSTALTEIMLSRLWPNDSPRATALIATEPDELL